jgi:hypothetical protein
MAAQNKIKTITPEFRLAFPSLFKKRAFKEGQTEKYEVTMLFNKKTSLQSLKDLCNEAATERWGKIPKGLKLPFRDGDEKEANGYAGTTYAAAKSLYPVAMINSDKTEIVEEQDLYAGCYCKGSVLVTPYEQKDGNAVVGRGIKFILRAVMKTRDGEPLFERTNAAEDFGAEEANDVNNFEDGGDDLADLGL